MFTSSESYFIVDLGVYAIWILKHGKTLPIGDSRDNLIEACQKYLDDKNEAIFLMDTIDWFCAKERWELPRDNYDVALTELREIRKNQKSLEAYMSECERLNNKVEELKEELNALKAAVNKDVWYWQGDGEDYPESLTCHVVMTASTLRELLNCKQ